MKTTIAAALAVAAAALTAAVAASATHAAGGTPSALDKHYLMSAAAGDHFEIKGGNLAKSKGSSSAVKRLGARLVTDHSKSLKETQKLASKLGVKVPSAPEPPMLWEFQQVSKQSGTAFDKAYASLEVADHKQDIKDAAEEASSGSDPAVKAAAKKEVPMLKMHLRLSQKALAAG